MPSQILPSMFDEESTLLVVWRDKTSEYKLSEVIDKFQVINKEAKIDQNGLIGAYEDENNEIQGLYFEGDIYSNSEC